MVPFAVLLLASAAPSDPADDYRLVNPKAIELFERDSTLMNWALARFDDDHDGYLSIMEADDAAREFKRIADGDGNGQVTPAEYRSARDFIVARWAVSSRK
jgi:hypothetical protein